MVKFVLKGTPRASDGEEAVKYLKMSEIEIKYKIMKIFFH